MGRLPVASAAGGCCPSGPPRTHGLPKLGSWWIDDTALWEEVSTPDEFQNAIQAANHDLVVVNWFASWCTGCKQRAAELEGLASDEEMRRKVKFVRACADGMIDVAKREADSLPYLGVYTADGKKVVGFSALSGKVNRWRWNLWKILESQGSNFIVDPDGFVLAIAKRWPRRRAQPLLK